MRNSGTEPAFPSRDAGRDAMTFEVMVVALAGLLVAAILIFVFTGGRN